MFKDLVEEVLNEETQEEFAKNLKKNLAAFIKKAQKIKNLSGYDEVGLRNIISNVKSGAFGTAGMSVIDFTDERIIKQIPEWLLKFAKKRGGRPRGGPTVQVGPERPRR